MEPMSGLRRLFGFTVWTLFLAGTDGRDLVQWSAGIQPHQLAARQRPVVGQKPN